MRHRAIPVVLATGIGLAALAGCSSTPSATPTVTDTVTATATVTATPAPVQAGPDDPMTPLAAWSICSAIAANGGAVDPKAWTPVPYSADAVNPASGGGYEVMLGFAPTGKGYGAGFNCTVGGTLGKPTVTDVRGPYDFG